MPADPLQAPDLAAITAAFLTAGAEFVVIGGFAARARDGVPVAREMLVGSTHLRASTRSGIVDLVREGVPPLDYATVARSALQADLGAGPFRLAGLASVVGFKRLAGRPQDRADLAELEAIHGALPVDPIPGLDP
jgi:hypothetical protein